MCCAISSEIESSHVWNLNHFGCLLYLFLSHMKLHPLHTDQTVLEKWHAKTTLICNFYPFELKLLKKKFKFVFVSSFFFQIIFCYGTSWNLILLLFSWHHLPAKKMLKSYVKCFENKVLMCLPGKFEFKRIKTAN